MRSSAAGRCVISLRLFLRAGPPPTGWVAVLFGGLVLATVAGAIIGQLWLYGNGGDGLFPPRAISTGRSISAPSAWRFTCHGWPLQVQYAGQAPEIGRLIQRIPPSFLS